MKTFVYIIIMFALFVSACAPTLPKSERYANMLISFPISSDHIRNHYAGTTKNEAYWAYSAIITGKILIVSYNKTLNSITNSDTCNTIISNMIITKDLLNSHLYVYSNFWSMAIKNHVENEYSCVDFSTALSIIQFEYARMGLFTTLDLIKKQIKNEVSQYDKDKYSKTYDMYAIISQLISLTEDPKGSLLNFNATVNRINDDFTKTLALAELEF